MKSSNVVTKLLPLALGQECTDNEVRLVDGFTDSYNGEGFAQLCYNGQWHYISSNTTDYVQQVCDQLGHKVKGIVHWCDTNILNSSI